MVQHINLLEPTLKPLTDDELKVRTCCPHATCCFFTFESRLIKSVLLQAKTGDLKRALARGETLDDLLPTAFAVVREASRRVMGMRHFDVQLVSVL